MSKHTLDPQIPGFYRFTEWLPGQTFDCEGKMVYLNADLTHWKDWFTSVGTKWQEIKVDGKVALYREGSRPVSLKDY